MRVVEQSAPRRALGYAAARLLEATLDAATLGRVREILWRGRVYLYVTPGPTLARQALAGFPRAVRELCAGVALRRIDERRGGGFYPDTNEIQLAAGVETYERVGQARLSARHELFHFVCWNHPWYRVDEERGFPRLIRAIEDSRGDVARFARYASWVRDSFLRQGDHANIVEFFADIPTNFPDPRELPPPLAAHLAPLLTGAAPDASRDGSRAHLALADFQRLIAS